jgi:hypothetical protein
MEEMARGVAAELARAGLFRPGPLIARRASRNLDDPGPYRCRSLEIADV